ncbi:MAG: ComF family protein [Candidatus Hydrogenedentes bacterium]|nr:ComF family protein [Candidatus Hydrogenedentota bacterium]
MRLSSDWSLTLRNLFLPIYCKQCGERILTDENGYFCATCWERSPRIERPFCPLCGRPHVGAVGMGTRSNFRCGPCSATPWDRPYRRILGAAVYDGAVEEAVKLLKFHDKPRLAGPLAELMGNIAREELDCAAYELLVPVPLHRVRRRERGFNQSQLLASELLPVFPNALLDESLERIRPTRVQSRLGNEAERRANVQGAFAVRSNGEVRGKTVLLVDDVITTGGTIAECALALRAAGASAVDVLAAALAMPHTARAQSG